MLAIVHCHYNILLTTKSLSVIGKQTATVAKRSITMLLKHQIQGPQVICNQTTNS